MPEIWVTLNYLSNHVTATGQVLTLNMSEAIRFKRAIQTSCKIDVKMLDIAEEGLVLYVERKTLNAESYKLLADFATQNKLSLQLDIGNFIISSHVLSPH